MVVRHRVYQRSNIPAMVSQRHGDPQKEWKMANVYKLYRPQQVQKLTGRIAALNRFIAKLAQRSLPFFSVLRGSAKVEWGPEQRKIFDDLKQYLQHFPTLSSPEQGQPLILYVSATHSIVSGALVVEKEAAQVGAVAK
jgi:hypothetical protein